MNHCDEFGYLFWSFHVKKSSEEALDLYVFMYTVKVCLFDRSKVLFFYLCFSSLKAQVCFSIVLTVYRLLELLYLRTIWYSNRLPGNFVIKGTKQSWNAATVGTIWPEFCGITWTFALAAFNTSKRCKRNIATGKLKLHYDKQRQWTS